jgi:hypothetical protein
LELLHRVLCPALHCPDYRVLYVPRNQGMTSQSFIIKMV